MLSLIAPVLWTVFVVVTLRPPFRTGRAGFVVYLFTVTINELPTLFLVVITATTLNGWSDRPSGPVGLAWLILWGFVAAGLVWVQLRAARTQPALDAALTAALGRDWRDSIRPDLARVLSTTTPWAAGVLLPFQRHRRDVERLRDVSYGPDPVHVLDIYRSRSHQTRRPILLHFHEGGFVQGGKSREAVTLLNQLAAHGWLCLSVNYRLRAAGEWPNPLVDVKRAMAWAREHAAEHDADPTHIHLAGGSAGGHLALNAALTQGDPRFQPGFEDADTSVSAAVSLYGYHGARTRDPASAPASLAGPDSPPLLLIHGAHDSALGQPLSTIRGWAGSLRSASGSPVVHAELPGAQHVFDLFASVRARATANGVESFLAWVRSQHPG